jgi:glycosyltransferase involved in cell wall biosynthesis
LYIPSMRLAWFSPMPPVRSGIADYSAELVPRLARTHQIDVFVASTDELSPASAADPFTLRSAHDFVWRQRRQPYDLVVYQMGNAWCHDYIWPYAMRLPGLMVLHDAQLHHARAWSLLRRQRRLDYRAELAFNHPDLPPEAAEIALSGFSGPLYYFWPMLRAAVTSARMVGVHNIALADHLAAEFPSGCFRPIRMGVADPFSTADGHSPRDARAMVRSHLGIAPETVVFAAFGGVTAEKRIGPILRALAIVRAYADVRLLLVGQSMPHYDVIAEARALGVPDLVLHAGFVDDQMLIDTMRAADVGLCLRWPSARETSASWLRALAAGLPTVVTDLAQQADVPTLDPRSWTVLDAPPDMRRREPVAISIDILDEDHSLTLALKRLATEADLRRTLGAAARQHWTTRHTLELMTADYSRALTDAATRPAPMITLPPHLRPDGLEHARALLSPFDLDPPWNTRHDSRAS